MDVRRRFVVLVLAAGLTACGEDKPRSGAGSSTGASPSTSDPVGGTSTGAVSGTPSGTPSDSGTTGTTSGTIGTTSGTTTTTSTCAAAMLVAGYLDALQTPGDGMVIFCHRGPGASWTLMNVAVPDCFQHIAHPNDLFPTTVCDS